MHRKIYKLEYGVERFCKGHKQILDSKYFPYKGVDLCLDCWEKKHNRKLHTFRKRLDEQYQIYY